MSTLDKLEKTSKKVLLATIGTYAKGWEILSDKTNKVLDDASKTFDELAEDGKAIEEDLKTKVAQNSQLSEKFAQIKSQLGIENTREERIEKLAEKINLLTTQVELLVDIEKMEAKQQAKTVEIASTSKLSTATTAQTAKKAETKSTPAKKATKASTQTVAKTTTKPVSRAKKAAPKKTTADKK